MILGPGNRPKTRKKALRGTSGGKQRTFCSWRRICATIRRRAPLLPFAERTDYHDSFLGSLSSRFPTWLAGGARAVPPVRIARRSCRVVLRRSISPMKNADSGLPQREPPSSREMVAGERTDFPFGGRGRAHRLARFFPWVLVASAPIITILSLGPCRVGPPPRGSVRSKAKFGADPPESARVIFNKGFLFFRRFLGLKMPYFSRQAGDHDPPAGG